MTCVESIKSTKGLRRRVRSCLLFTALVLALVAAGALWLFGDTIWYMVSKDARVDISNLDDFEVQGAALVDRLEAHAAATDRYPEDLQELTEYEPRWSAWEYRSREDGREFTLWVGRYIVDRFVLIYDSETPGWHKDT